MKLSDLNNPNKITAVLHKKIGYIEIGDNQRRSTSKIAAKIIVAELEKCKANFDSNTYLAGGIRQGFDMAVAIVQRLTK